MYQNDTLNTSDLHNVTCPIHPTGQKVPCDTYYIFFGLCYNAGLISCPVCRRHLIGIC